MSTSLKELLGTNNEQEMNEQVQQQQQAQQVQQVQETPVEAKKNEKDFFSNFKDFDYKTAILVFCIILVVTSGIFYTILKPIAPGTIGPDGKFTLIGSILIAFFATIIFVLIKTLLKF